MFQPRLSLDSSLEDDKEKVRLISEKYHTKYFYKDVSVSAKRNYGAKHCRYEVVLFLDSDCLATHGLLKYAREHPDAGGQQRRWNL